MARIRTIKPEFPQSESMGRVSREARLCFVLLWTICDDSGRTRAASRMLASLLYPYDDDAANHIEGWLDELEAEGCIVRYAVDGSHYLQVKKWSDHQKIDKPSKSRIPTPPEPSRILANIPDTPAKPLERSSEDLGREGTKEGKGGEGNSIGDKPPENIPPEPPPEEEKPRKKFIPPTLEEVEAYCQERKNTVHAEKFISHYTSNGWKVGKNRMVDWKAAVRTWENNGNGNGRDHPLAGKVSPTTMRNMEVLSNWEPPS